MRANYLTIIIATTFFIVPAPVLRQEDAEIPSVSCNAEASDRIPQPELFNLSRAQVIEKTLKPACPKSTAGRPYNGISVKGVDNSTMTGKVLCGYQGWFTCPGDGSARGWFHWGSDVFKPGYCSIDLWPDMTEYSEDECYPTPFKFADGSPAYVFSSMHPKTVDRHFKWMADYGIDGAFVQRFVTETIGEKQLLHTNTVLANCRAAANRHGRVYAVMYDLSGLQKAQTSLVIEDWKMLVDKMHLTKSRKGSLSGDANDHAYLHHNGKPVVAVWGIGFKERDYTLQECAKLVDFLKNDKDYGGYTIMLGLPTYWQTLKNDSVSDPYLHDIVRNADILSPWMVGRIRNTSDINEFVYNRIWVPDMEWCKKYNKEYLPVVFPGFSWNNLKKDPKVFNMIPRLGGKFLWKQYVEAKKIGATMIYQAMFDEVDEGTAIFKCTNNPPVGASKFLTYEGLPSDYYLWLVGQAGRMLRGEIPLTEEIPKRKE